MRHALHRISLAALLGCASASWACGNSPVITTTKSDGTRVGLVITQDQVARSPIWSPASGEPPLSVSQAYRKAMDWAANAYARYDSVSAREISLSQFFCTAGKGRWYYRLELAPVFDGNPVWGGGHWAAVLMDGTVIGPTEIQ